jgi:hypothetical protein
VGRPGVVADQQVAAGKEGDEGAEIGPAGEIEGMPSGIACDVGRELTGPSGRP